MRDTKLERDYQAALIERLRELLPGCFILKNDSGYLQGVPDLLVLFRDRWAMLEVKPHERAVQQPNQEYYIDELNQMSFAAFIFPENEEDVLNDLQQAFQSRRKARISQPV